jgi:hypothetical protein
MDLVNKEYKNKEYLDFLSSVKSLERRQKKFLTMVLCFGEVEELGATRLKSVLGIFSLYCLSYLQFLNYNYVYISHSNNQHFILLFK